MLLTDLFKIHHWALLGLNTLGSLFAFPLACSGKYIENVMVHCTYSRYPRAPLCTPNALP